MTEIQRIKIARNNVPYKYEEHEEAVDTPLEITSPVNANEKAETPNIRHVAGPARKRTKKNTDQALMPKVNVNTNTETVKTRRQSKAATVYDENDENTMNTSTG